MCLLRFLRLSTTQLANLYAAVMVTSQVVSIRVKAHVEFVKAAYDASYPG